MTITHFEGFDIQQWNFDWAYGVDDLSNYWVPWSQYLYVPGAVEGRAINYQTPTTHFLYWAGGTQHSKLPRGGEVNVYFAFRYRGGGDLNQGQWAPLFFLQYGSGNLQPERNFGIQIRRDGFIRLGRGGITLGPHNEDLTVQALTTPFDPRNYMIEDMDLHGGWAYVRLQYRPQTDRLTLWLNGNEIASVVTNAPVDANFNWTCGFNRSSGVFVEIDHIVIADQGLPSTGTHAMAVQAMQAQVLGSDSWITGALVMDGQLIRAAQVFPQEWYHGRPLDPGFLGHSNPMNEVQWVWGRDPRDNSPWTETKLNDIQAWGVCARNPGSSEGHPGRVQRISSLFYTYVETTTKGFAPLVRMKPPSAAIYLEDIWEKSNPDKSYAAHLGEVPRVNTFADDEYLDCNRTGCLLFKADSGRPFDWVGLTFAQEYREDFFDWLEVQGYGENFTSWFITGYSVLGDSNKDFQSNYITVNYQQTVEPGGAYLQPIWEYAIDPNTGRWGTKQQVYKNENGYKHSHRKLKARGHGKALQFKVSSEDQKDFIINGWGVFVLANQLP